MAKRLLTVGAVLAVAGCAVAQEQSGSRATAKAEQPSAQPQPQALSTSQPATPAEPRPDYMPRLMVGDNAPSLSIESWLKGDAVTGFEKGRTYIVEFWATWCLPCHESMPHLTHLQREFKDRGLTVIGVTSSEPGGLEDVVPFIEARGDTMGYTVAWDRDGQTDTAWRKAAGLTSIPAAMIVNGDGKVAWIGHPTFPKGEMDTVLQEVLAGTFNLNVAADRERAVVEIMHRAQLTWADGDQRRALDIIASMIDLDANRYSSAAMQKLQGLLVHLRDTEAGYAWANELIEGIYKNNAAVLNEIAWTIVEAPGLEPRNLDLALRAARQAESVTGGNEPGVLDTLARVHFAMGNVEGALELQSRAAELVTDDTLKDAVNSRLEQYRRASVDTTK